MKIGCPEVTPHDGVAVRMLEGNFGWCCLKLITFTSSVSDCITHSDPEIIVLKDASCSLLRQIQLMRGMIPIQKQGAKESGAVQEINQNVTVFKCVPQRL